ncbi:copper amine oxidase N-terminal domain-containing protein [Paenibacillus koleovorans]|uniref:copper amine oxidase N-terminal domain-containing protein n=1 Tax=Paenibacillus koleovorans TaxID=121608 RepID=UPI000FD916F2|nr:copper amine oxidase N-terminal domain-containing protein [Paenibacillus koleovorans]
MKRKSWRWKKLAAILSVVLVVVITSCQAISGFDVNKALVEAMVAKSMEGKGEYTLSLVLDEKAQIDPSRLAMLKLFETVKVKLDSIKMESTAKLSMKGSALIAKYNIPFEAALNEEQMVLKIEGAKKPLVFDLAEAKGDAAAAQEMPPFYTELQKKLSDGELTSSMMAYLVKQLPNPSKLSVDNVIETINGESVSLHKLHGEITGKELIPLAKAFVKNALKDDESLKELIGQLYDALYPLLSAELEKAITAPKEEELLFDDADLDFDEAYPGIVNPFSQLKTAMDPILNGLKAVLDDREIAIEVIHTEVKQVFVILLVALESLGAKEQKSWEAAFNENSYFKTDLYFDNRFKLRKSNSVIQIAPQMEDSNGLTAIRIEASTENWNVNEKVQADSIPLTGGGMTFTRETQPTDFLQNLDPKSDVYQLFRKDLGIAKVSFPLYIGAGLYIPGVGMPYIENGVTMVPTRFISERLHAKIEWDPATQNIKVLDTLSSRTIVLHAGNKVALVDGKSVEMEQEVVVRDDTSYVPLSFIVTQLGGRTEWNDEMRAIQITRE